MHGQRRFDRIRSLWTLGDLQGVLQVSSQMPHLLHGDCTENQDIQLTTSSAIQLRAAAFPTYIIMRITYKLTYMDASKYTLML